MTSAAVALTVLAGLAGSIQVADGLRRARGAELRTVIQLVLSMGILLAAGVGGLAARYRSPTWMWLGAEPWG